uniref:Uncharacterized protein n=1 Tax=Moorena producens (strain JHB) TaxID=1454205 RepID=A0A1D9G7H6_MOOP1
MLFWANLGRSYKGLSFQKMIGGSIWEFIFFEIIGIKALSSKLFRGHVTPSARNLIFSLVKFNWYGNRWGHLIKGNLAEILATQSLQANCFPPRVSRLGHRK